MAWSTHIKLMCRRWYSVESLIFALKVLTLHGDIQNVGISTLPRVVIDHRSRLLTFLAQEMVAYKQLNCYFVVVSLIFPIGNLAAHLYRCFLRTKLRVWYCYTQQAKARLQQTQCSKVHVAPKHFPHSFASSVCLPYISTVINNSLPVALPTTDCKLEPGEVRFQGVRIMCFFTLNLVQKIIVSPIMCVKPAFKAYCRIAMEISEAQYTLRCPSSR